MRPVAEAAAETRLTVGFRFTDTGEEYGLEIRRGIAVFHPEPPRRTDAALVTSADTVHRLLLGGVTSAGVLADGNITVEGDPAVVHRFFEHFEKPSGEPSRTVLR